MHSLVHLPKTYGCMHLHPSMNIHSCTDIHTGLHLFHNHLQLHTCSRTPIRKQADRRKYSSHCTQPSYQPASMNIRHPYLCIDVTNKHVNVPTTSVIMHIPTPTDAFVHMHVHPFIIWHIIMPASQCRTRIIPMHTLTCMHDPATIYAFCSNTRLPCYYLVLNSVIHTLMHTHMHICMHT